MIRITVYQDGKAVGGVQIDAPTKGRKTRMALGDERKTVIIVTGLAA